ncbi:MAG: c-type cytochrome biogenesis protein CcmI [Pseudomonadota bacterium]
MAFWIVAGALSIAVGLAVWRAVLRVKGGVAGDKPGAAYDLDIYRDQLHELDRDKARGIIGDAEAERARVEISRRILDADRALSAEHATKPGATLPIALALSAVIGGAVILYGFIGSPNRPDLPLAERIAAIEAARADRPNQNEAEAAAPPLPTDAVAPELAALRAAMAEPGAASDTEGWLALAQAEARAGNYPAARRAQEQAVALMGPRANAQIYVDLARMRILAAGGYVSPQAETSLRQALQINPNAGDARFLLGAMYQRQNRPDLAFPIWRDLLADSGPDDPWVGPILDQIQEVAFFAGQRVDLNALAAARASGPTQSQMEAAATMSPQERRAMVEEMVDGLASRLNDEGGPVEEWARLIGAYGVLARIDAAHAVLAEARAAFAGDAAAQALLDAAAAALPAP